MFTAFLLQSVMLQDYTNTMAQLAWFENMLTPRPIDPRSAIAEPKGKGKGRAAEPKG